MSSKPAGSVPDGVDHLFVYGSLRRDSGHAIHRVLAEGASFVGRASVRGELYDLGWHPGAVPSADEQQRVQGEVYRLHDPARMLTLLDHYEGCGPKDPTPHLFARERAEVLIAGGARVASWVYWYRGATHGAARIETGEWRLRG
jgi:gamma-glutamylcyclotransferase (GGCT)/AIG2-like uncharacterized protein YtfP